ncbi:MAG: hypothetical protein H7144_11995 [Burkholderiales bacterium]|nr:hypothetical protein [Phycisphaerae bacterium]
MIILAFQLALSAEPVLVNAPPPDSWKLVTDASNVSFGVIVNGMPFELPLMKKIEGDDTGDKSISNLIFSGKNRVRILAVRLKPDAHLDIQIYYRHKDVEKIVAAATLSEAGPDGWITIEFDGENWPTKKLPWQGEPIKIEASDEAEIRGITQQLFDAMADEKWETVFELNQNKSDRFGPNTATEEQRKMERLRMATELRQLAHYPKDRLIIEPQSEWEVVADSEFNLVTVQSKRGKPIFDSKEGFARLKRFAVMFSKIDGKWVIVN